MIKLNEFEKTLIKEINTLSDQSESSVREVLEFTLLRQVEQLLNGDPISIPFIGKLTIEYVGDDFVEGARIAQIKSSFEPSDLLKRLVGDVEDGESEMIEEMLSSKTRAALQYHLDKK